MIADDIRFVIDSHDNMFVLDRPIAHATIPHLFIDESVVTRSNDVIGYLIDKENILEIDGAVVVIKPDSFRVTGLCHNDGFLIRDVPVGSLCFAECDFKGSWREIVSRYRMGEFCNLEWEALHMANARGGYVPIPGNRIVEYSQERYGHRFKL
ncbi:MAG: hypothetical protein LUD47_05225 [Clostridia bacterium]|nr:hypothetical protein [Clostridia bacterium]